ncbi:MAG: FAD-dependent monooxygenase, partial [Xanthobacteraceae bacterium]
MSGDKQRVIVVGAGPVGVIATLALVRKGIPVLLIEAEPEPVEDQRAATIHAPTLEMLADLGLRQQAFADDA